SGPAFSFRRLRAESPETYEAYADMETGAWTHLRVEVTGARARLYVNRTAQPALIVNDLKLGDTHGAIPHVHRRLFCEPSREITWLPGISGLIGPSCCVSKVIAEMPTPSGASDSRASLVQSLPN